MIELTYRNGPFAHEGMMTEVLRYFVDRIGLIGNSSTVYSHRTKIEPDRRLNIGLRDRWNVVTVSEPRLTRLTSADNIRIIYISRSVSQNVCDTILID